MPDIKKNTLMLLIPLLLSGCYVEKKPTDCGLYDFNCSNTTVRDTDYPLQTKNKSAPLPSDTAKQQDRMEYLEHRLLKLEQELFRLRKQLRNK